MNERYFKLTIISLLSVVFLSHSSELSYVLPISQAMLVVSETSTQPLQYRQEFSIPLAKISVTSDDVEKKFLRVKILQSNNRDYSLITSTDDTYIKNTSKGVVKSVYREGAIRSYYITDFEAKEIKKVCKGFIQTLEIFEHDLKNNRFDRCYYLDAFFPRFLKGFIVLLSLAQNYDSYRKVSILLPESEYDVSLSSLKTDYRIKQWQTKPDYILKLRIASKELVYQLKQWDKDELSVSDRNPELSKIDSIEEILVLFIKVYLNLPADTNSIKER